MPNWSLGFVANVNNVNAVRRQQCQRCQPRPLSTMSMLSTMSAVNHVNRVNDVNHVKTPTPQPAAAFSCSSACGGVSGGTPPAAAGFSDVIDAVDVIDSGRG